MLSSEQKRKESLNKGRPKKYSNADEAREARRLKQKERYYERKRKTDAELDMGRDCYNLLNRLVCGDIDIETVKKEFNELRIADCNRKWTS